MGRKLTVLILIGLLLAIGACSSSAGALEEESKPLNHKTIQVASIPFALSSLAEACIEKVQHANKNAPFICPAIIEHNIFHKGHKYSWDTVVYSGSSENTTFKLVATESSDPRPGYISASKKLLELITIQDRATDKQERTGIIADFEPYETKVFKITLEIPRKTEIPPRWEFRIRVKNTSQGSNVQVALDQRVLIDVKD